MLAYDMNQNIFGYGIILSKYLEYFPTLQNKINYNNIYIYVIL